LKRSVGSVNRFAVSQSSPHLPPGVRTGMIFDGFLWDKKGAPPVYVEGGIHRADVSESRLGEAKRPNDFLCEF
jgi:hypothetical protein